MCVVTDPHDARTPAQTWLLHLSPEMCAARLAEARLGRLAVIDPETGDRVVADTSRRALRDRFARLEAERRLRLHDELHRLRVGHVPLSIEGEWLAALGRGLR